MQASRSTVGIAQRIIIMSLKYQNAYLDTELGITSPDLLLIQLFIVKRINVQFVWILVLI